MPQYQLEAHAMPQTTSVISALSKLQKHLSIYLHIFLCLCRNVLTPPLEIPVCADLFALLGTWASVGRKLRARAEREPDCAPVNLLIWVEMVGRAAMRIHSSL